MQSKNTHYQVELTLKLIFLLNLLGTIISCFLILSRMETFDSVPFSLAYCLLFQYSLKSPMTQQELTAPFRSDWIQVSSAGGDS